MDMNYDNVYKTVANGSKLLSKLPVYFCSYLSVWDIALQGCVLKFGVERYGLIHNLVENYVATVC